jgi:hypothetical protein
MLTEFGDGDQAVGYNREKQLKTGDEFVNAERSGGRNRS